MNTTYSTYFQTARAVAAYQERSYRNHLHSSQTTDQTDLFQPCSNPYRGLYRYFDNRIFIQSAGILRTCPL